MKWVSLAFNGAPEMLFYSWVAGAGRGPACVLAEKHPLGDAAISTGKRSPNSWSISSMLN